MNLDGFVPQPAEGSQSEDPPPRFGKASFRQQPESRCTGGDNEQDQPELWQTAYHLWLGRGRGKSDQAERENSQQAV
jgi:hypothetical protein